MNEVKYPWKYIVIKDGVVVGFCKTRSEATHELNYYESMKIRYPYSSLYIARIEFYNGDLVT